MILILLQVLGRVFAYQLLTQRGFVEKRRAKEVVTPAERLGSRIKSAEFATLLGSVFIVILMVLLVVFSLQGVISLSSTIVFFLGLRLMNTTFSSISSALMRFARAKANSF
jgi:1,4-dihydroxy-2-naphthoate octaprenyltransferase